MARAAAGSQPLPGDGARLLAPRATWVFLGGAVAAVVVALLSSSEALTSFLFDVIGLAAAGAALIGLGRNRPPRAWPWLLVTTAILLSAAGDVVYDVAVRAFGAESGFPYADVLYLPAYPLLAVALWQLVGARRRDALVDSAIVALAAGAVMWQWVVEPMMATPDRASVEGFVAVLYPVMDVVLVVALVHAVLTLPRLITSARLLLAGMTLMLVADAVFARLVAENSYVDGGALDGLWPLAYALLAAAVLHPSMRDLDRSHEPGIVSSGRARVVVLAAALFSVPAIVVVEGASSGEALALTAVIAAIAGLIGWRVTRLVTETNQARVEIGESEARFRALVQHSNDAIAVIGADGRLTFATPAIAAILGLDPEDVVGMRAGDLLHPDDLPVAADQIEVLRSHAQASIHQDLRAQDVDGTWHWLEATFTNQLDEPSIGGIVANFRDITERRRLEHAGAGETRVLELILSGAVVTETLQRVTSIVEEFVPGSAAIVRLVSAESGALETVAAPTLPMAYVRAIDADAEDRVAPTDHEAAALGALGDPLVVEDLATDHPDVVLPPLSEAAHGLRSFWSLPVRGSGDRVVGHLAVFTRAVRGPTEAERGVLERARDLVVLALDRAEHTKQLGFLALHDTLTTLPNRALGVERLDAALGALPESGPVVAALFLDLDRFKVVNDGLGHETGDELLVAVGRRLLGSVRREDTVARFGGDEFVVICEHLRDEAQAVELAQRALDALSRPFALSRAEVVVNASIGIALTDRSSDRASDLLRDADAAMYRAKGRGGGRYELFDHAMHTQAVTRLLTERALRQSLEHDELRMVFQPEFDLQTRERVGAEALLRWDHPVRGMVPPGEFLLVAEETGLIVPIGDWVLDEVCDRLAASGGDGTALPISLNVSVRQLLQADFPERVRRSVAARDVDPSLLCFEIAERVLLDDHDAIRESVHALKRLGVRLAIDDFGTGGSSLSYLRRFPFDELKIDGTFVAGLGSDQADDAIIAATIDMAHALGMRTVAEGIETEAQLRRLVELGCERGQGYHLAPPSALEARHLRLVQRPA